MSLAYLDVDDTISATFGYAKQCVGYCCGGVKGPNALLATSGRRTTLQLPTAWTWAAAWQHLFIAAIRPSATA